MALPAPVGAVGYDVAAAVSHEFAPSPKAWFALLEYKRKLCTAQCPHRFLVFRRRNQNAAQACCTHNVWLHSKLAETTVGFVHVKAVEGPRGKCKRENKE